MAHLLQISAFPSAVAFTVYLVVTWYGEVMREVPDPYLASFDVHDAF
jgi:hypothetical protein